jgi:hypothetical protein
MRLNGWHNEDPNAVPGHLDNGDAALKALTDVDLVRGLLDRCSMHQCRNGRTRECSVGAG